MRRLSLLLTAAGLAAGSPMARADIAAAPGFKTYLESSGERAAVATIAHALAERHARACRGGPDEGPLRVGDGYAVSLGAPPEIGADGAPRGGWWIARVDATVCGAATRINIQSQADGDGHLTRLGLVNGTTRIPAANQGTAIGEALAAAAPAIPAACRDPRIQTSVGPDNAGTAPWSEDWTVDACGEPIHVTLQVPGLGHAGEARASLAEAVEAEAIDILRPAGSDGPVRAAYASTPRAPAPRAAPTRTVSTTVPVRRTVRELHTVVVWRTVYRRVSVHAHAHPAHAAH